LVCKPPTLPLNFSCFKSLLYYSVFSQYFSYVLVVLALRRNYEKCLFNYWSGFRLPRTTFQIAGSRLLHCNGYGLLSLWRMGHPGSLIFSCPDDHEWSRPMPLGYAHEPADVGTRARPGLAVGVLPG
jgi:hypothetical protein